MDRNGRMLECIEFDFRFDIGRRAGNVPQTDSLDNAIHNSSFGRPCHGPFYAFHVIIFVVSHCVVIHYDIGNLDKLWTILRFIFNVERMTDAFFRSSIHLVRGIRERKIDIPGPGTIARSSSVTAFEVSHTIDATSRHPIPECLNAYHWLWHRL